MRTKKDKEKPGYVPGQRHSSAANYELTAQSAMLHDHSDEYVLQLFEQMLVRTHAVRTIISLECPLNICEFNLKTNDI